MPDRSRAGSTVGSGTSAGMGLAPLLALIPFEGPLKDRAAASFSKYLSSGGVDLEIAVDRDAFLSAVHTGNEEHRAVVLWDVRAGMPPKEIESAVQGFGRGAYRAGVRFDPRSIRRGRSSFVLDRVLAAVRKMTGRISDPHPSFLVAPSSFLRQRSDELATVPEGVWIDRLLGGQHRERVRFEEVPVMWAEGRPQ